MSVQKTKGRKTNETPKNLAPKIPKAVPSYFGNPPQEHATPRHERGLQAVNGLYTPDLGIQTPGRPDLSEPLGGLRRLTHADYLLQTMRLMSPRTKQTMGRSLHARSPNAHTEFLPHDDL